MSSLKATIVSPAAAAATSRKSARNSRKKKLVMTRRGDVQLKSVRVPKRCAPVAATPPPPPALDQEQKHIKVLVQLLIQARALEQEMISARRRLEDLATTSSATPAVGRELAQYELRLRMAMLAKSLAQEGLVTIRPSTGTTILTQPGIETLARTRELQPRPQQQPQQQQQQQEQEQAEDANDTMNLSGASPENEEPTPTHPLDGRDDAHFDPPAVSQRNLYADKSLDGLSDEFNAAPLMTMQAHSGTSDEEEQEETSLSPMTELEDDSFILADAPCTSWMTKTELQLETELLWARAGGGAYI
jgi:hypothetical protein